VRLAAAPSGLAFKAGWRVPGPRFGSDFPEALVFAYRGVPRASTARWLASTAAVADARGWPARWVRLADGAPALTVSLPQGGTAPGVPAGEQVGVYLVYATERKGYYYLVFQSDSAHFSAEERTVQKVFDKFRGYDYTGT
jgi:hypothetical protein